MTTKKLAVHFGAGNIGRGFLAQLYTESGFRVLFVDVLDTVVNALHERGVYPLDIVETDATTRLWIQPVDALHASRADAVADVLVQADVASTAVGAAVLPRLAATLARGIEKRAHLRSGDPLNIILCENLHDAAALLRPLVLEQLQDRARAWAEHHVGFINASIGRMVPVMTDAQKAEDPLLVRVEPYCELPIDADAIVSPFPEIRHVKPIPGFMAYVERKLYVHNLSHAATAYLGWLREHHFIWQAVEDPEVARVAQIAAMESCRALARRRGLSLPDLEVHVKDLFQRYRNRALGDTVERVARDPVRKLGPEDRIIGAARQCVEAGIAPEHIAMVAVAATRYRNPGDASACRIQDIMSHKGLSGVLTEIAGLSPGDELFSVILAADQAFSARFPARVKPGS